MAMAKLAVVIAILIPMAWSFMLELVRRLGQRSRHPLLAPELVEQAMLLLMIAPVLAAAGLGALAMLAPSAGTVLPHAIGLTLDRSASPVLHNVPHSLDWVGIASFGVAMLYLAGALRLLLRLVQEHLRLRRVVAGSVDASEAWGAGVRLSTAVVPAFAAGRACIVLPDALVRSLSAEQVALIVRHERTHQRRGGPRRFLAFALVEVACWCNPIVRRQAERCRLAAELACDAAATEGATGLRRSYAEALVIALRHNTAQARFTAAANFPSVTHGDYGMRITEIMRPSGLRSRRLTRIPVAIGLLLAGPLALLQADMIDAAVTRPAIGTGLLLLTARLVTDHLHIAAGGKLILDGHVSVRQDGLDLQADHVVLTARNSTAAAAHQYNMLVAEGNVEARVSEAAMKLLGTKVSFTSDAIVRDGDALVLHGAKVTLATQPN